MNAEHIITKASEAIIAADTLLITAGAGMGVDSGLPVFRGNKGFWNMHPIYEKQRLTFADLANPMWFHHHPERAWGFYAYRYNLYRQTVPHVGFEILQKWLNQKSNPGFVYTSNVDGQFQKAGFPTDRIYECHGSIHYLQCVVNCTERIWPVDDLMIEVDTNQFLAFGDLPMCPDCGGIARPNILMFGDDNWISALADLQRNAFQQWSKQAVKTRLAIIEIGAGFSVGRVRSVSQSLPGTLIRINPCDSEGPAGTLSIPLKAFEALQAMDQAIESL